MDHEFSRRTFMAAATAAGVGLSLGKPAAAAEKPAILGGRPVRTQPFPSWPITDELDVSLSALGRNPCREPQRCGRQGLALPPISMTLRRASHETS
jgi:hypothetical protein